MTDNYVDDWDPEKLIQCPYDKSHMIRACRFPYHLVKCRKNHPDIAQLLMTCPFNARHQVPRAEMSQHIASCDDKSFIEQDVASQLDNYKKGPNVVSTWKPPPCEEDWDKDLDESKSVFIWGISRCGTNRSSSNLAMGFKSHLPSDLRVPRSLPPVLPWKNSTGN